MSDQLVDSAERLFAAHTGKAVLHSAGQGAFPAALWQAVTEAGFTAALLPEEAGGFGATVREALQILQVSAAHTAPIPLAETMLAGWLLARAGLSAPEGVLTVAPVRVTDKLTLHRVDDAWRLSGSATRVPWARDAAIIVVLATGPDGLAMAKVPSAGLTIAHDVSLAGEPRDTVTFDVLLPEKCRRAGPARVRPAAAARRRSRVADRADRRGAVQNAGAHRGVCPNANSVRPSHREIPSHPAEPGRAGRSMRCGRCGCRYGGRCIGRRSASLARRCGQGAGRGGGEHRGWPRAPGAWGDRLHPGIRSTSCYPAPLVLA